MNRLLLTISLVATFAGAPVAQGLFEFCPRGRSKVNTTFTPFSQSAWKVAAPRQDLPGDAARGLAPTAQVVYAVWVDEDQARNTVLRFLRSTDGGWSWDSSRAQDILVADFFNFERFNAQDIDLIAEGNDVWIALNFNVDTQGVAQRDDYCWVLGSRDQGQTWKRANISRGIDSPLSTGDVLNDVDNINAAASNGRLHVVWEIDYDNAVGGNGATANHDTYYQIVEYDARGELRLVFAEEKRIEDSPSGAFDSDLPHIAVAGNNVLICWQDDRNSIVNGRYQPNNTRNDTWSRTSNDGGRTFRPAVNHTNLQIFMLVPPERSQAVALGDELLVIQSDRRFGSTGKIWASVSQDAGATWVDDRLICRTPLTATATDMYVDADGDRVVVSYSDTRFGSTNGTVFVAIDDRAGRDFRDDTFRESIVADTQRTDQAFPVAVRGDLIAVATEARPVSSEGAAVGVSTDGGRTFRLWIGDDGSRADTDDPWVTITAGGDVNLIWIDDGGGSNSTNDVWITGLKAPRLTWDAATSTFALTDLPPQAIGNLALLLPSLTPPASNGFLLPGADLRSLNFSADAATGAWFQAVFGLQRIVNINGASWTLPNFASLIGQPIHWTVATFGANNQWTPWFTDPIELR